MSRVPTATAKQHQECMTGGFMHACHAIRARSMSSLRVLIAAGRLAHT
jgi:hypothetical protein